MKKLIAASILFAGFSAHADNAWYGKPWKVEKTLCPVECSAALKKQLESTKGNQVSFDDWKATLPELIGSCAPPATPNWSTLQSIELGKYLGEWIKAPKGKKGGAKDVATALGSKPSQKVQAGVVNCSDGTAFNFVYVDEKKAFLIFEESSVFELTR